MGNMGSGEFIVILFLLSYVITPFLSYKIAKKKNRSAAGWVIAALLFGWLAVLIIAILPENQNSNAAQSAPASMNQPKTVAAGGFCASCGSKILNAGAFCASCGAKIG